MSSRQAMLSTDEYTRQPINGVIQSRSIPRPQCDRTHELSVTCTCTTITEARLMRQQSGCREWMT